MLTSCLKPLLGLFIFLALQMAGPLCQAQSKGNKGPASLIQEPFKPRAYYGARLEPKQGIVTGAGQSNEAFEKYVTAMGPEQTPIIYMTYMGIKGLDSPEKVFNRMKHLREQPGYHVPQIGLSFTHDGKPELCYDSAVAAGVYDKEIDNFCQGLKMLGRPAYVRVGYEFNGHWNGYKPEYYKQAYNRIGAAIRKHGLENVALVWCFAVDGNEDDFMKFYPGPQYVDWWSIDVFGEDHFAKPELRAFLDSAEKYKRPVLIGECTPRRVSTYLGEEAWRRWYAKYFEMIHFNPGIKALSYINWNWEKTNWPDWGDGRIEGNDYVLKYYKAEMAHPMYLHSQGEKKVKKVLRAKK